jgi:hypothetical protein
MQKHRTRFEAFQAVLIRVPSGFQLELVRFAQHRGIASESHSEELFALQGSPQQISELPIADSLRVRCIQRQNARRACRPRFGEIAQGLFRKPNKKTSRESRKKGSTQHCLNYLGDSTVSTLSP